MTDAQIKTVKMDVKAAVICINLLSLFAIVGSRQMCLTCQFQSAVANYATSSGFECVDAPLNWTGGETRMRCPHKCIISATYDSATSLPTFFFRGCRSVTTERENGCTKMTGYISCFYSCGDGDNYCNSLTSFDDLEDVIDDKDKKKKKGNNDGDDIVASLYCLMALTAVCAIGYFVKKKYCTPKEEDLEEGAVH